MILGEKFDDAIQKLNELEESLTVRDFRTVRQEGKRQVIRNLTYYNLDAIISIGFRVNSKRGILFRQWANKVLKDYLLKGYSINLRLNDIEQRMDNRFFQIERTIAEHDKKIGFFVRTSLPPIEGIFYNGQYVPIDIRTYRDSHDRFLVVDEMDVYHIGASLKDLGKKKCSLAQN